MAPRPFAPRPLGVAIDQVRKVPRGLVAMATFPARPAPVLLEMKLQDTLTVVPTPYPGPPLASAPVTPPSLGYTEPSRAWQRPARTLKTPTGLTPAVGLARRVPARRLGVPQPPLPCQCSVPRLPAEHLDARLAQRRDDRWQSLDVLHSDTVPTVSLCSTQVRAGRGTVWLFASVRREYLRFDPFLSRYADAGLQWHHRA